MNDQSIQHSKQQAKPEGECDDYRIIVEEISPNVPCSSLFSNIHPQNGLPFTHLFETRIFTVLELIYLTFRTVDSTINQLYTIISCLTVTSFFIQLIRLSNWYRKVVLAYCTPVEVNSLLRRIVISRTCCGGLGLYRYSSVELTTTSKVEE